MLVDCDSSPQEEVKRHNAIANQMSDEVTYCKDIRTGICFARFDGGSMRITQVPCNQEVEKNAILFMSKP